VDDDVVKVFGDAETFRQADRVRRAVEQPGVGHERGGLREPRGIPVAGDFAPVLVTRAGAAVEAFVCRRGKE